MTRALRRGPLALVGGKEFMPGNEPQDEVLVGAAHSMGKGHPAFIVATAAVRQVPDRAVATARTWFSELGLAVEELPVRTRGSAMSEEVASAAAQGSFFYLCGGDPGLVVRTLIDTPVWRAIVTAWRGGAALGGSSAGAMALGTWTLIRTRMPGDARREPRAALDLIPRIAVLPHHATFGWRWAPSATAALQQDAAVLVGIDERTALVRHTGLWRVLGRGSVTVIGPSGQERRFAAGARVSGVPAPRR